MRVLLKGFCGVFLILLVLSGSAYSNCLPKNFVYLKDIAPSIQQDIRYAGYHNFIGRPIKGYGYAQCVLTRRAALALKNVQQELQRSGLSLKVYDCYRPQRAVNDFIAWSKLPQQQNMKEEFYPHVNKANFFKLGYVASRSGHSRGSTVDLTIVNAPLSTQEIYHPGEKLYPCFAPYKERFHDNSIDMGTGFDCMDPRSHNDSKAISVIAYRHRKMLQSLMESNGFVAYEPEWWHFTLKDEPYPNQYFDCAMDSIKK